jgi:F-type H+-transporting ATPase subunit epsilon
VSLAVRIVTPRKVAWEGTAQSVQAPGELGEFGVLPKHIPFLTTLRPGPMVVDTGSSKLKFTVGLGFCEAGPDRVTVLTESCEESAPG